MNPREKLIEDINIQLVKIETRGGYVEGIWQTNDLRYIHKHEILKTTIEYLNGHTNIHLLRILVGIDEQYDKGGILRSETGKLLDRALELKGDTLLEPVDELDELINAPSSPRCSLF